MSEDWTRRHGNHKEYDPASSVKLDAENSESPSRHNITNSSSKD